MKKILYGTSALLVAGLFASAAEAAQPLKLTVGGYLNAWMGYTDIKHAEDGIYNKFDVATDGQVVFNAATTLDNGMKIGAVAEMNIGNGNNQAWLGDVYAYAESKFGKVVLGATDNGAVMLHHDAPNASPLTNDDLITWMGFNAIPVFLDATAPDLDGNAQKITYITPSFAGFKAAFSYIPGADFKPAFGSANGALDDSVIRWGGADFVNAYTVTAAYDGKFGNVKFGADVGYASYNIQGAEATRGFNGALTADFSGFTAMVGYIYSDWRNAVRIDNSHAYQVGLGYKADKFAVSASWLESVIKPEHDGDDPKLDILRVDGSYKLGAGVDAFATFGYVKSKNAVRTTKDPKAWTIVTGLGLTF